jgi:Phage tail protein
MILKTDTLNVTIDGVIFRSSPFKNPQYVLDEKAVEGFLDGVDVRRSETVRPNQWGDFYEPSLLGSRHISLTGSAIARNPAELLQMRDGFVSLFRGGQYREISIQNSVGKRYMMVALESQPSWVQKLDSVAVWKLDLYAPDPRMYGEIMSIQITDNTIKGGIDYPMDYPLDYGGEIKVQTLAVTNNGNTESYPVFKVTGNYLSGFSISDTTGRTLKFDGIVTNSAPVIIDNAAGTATQNGTDVTTLLSRRDWISVPAGGSLQPFFIPTVDGVGWCDIMYRDTWI